MKLVPLHTLFRIQYGNSLELINLEQCLADNEDAINYVSRTEKNNGIAAIVKRSDLFAENPAKTISVALGGSVLSSFLQPKPYYTGFHVYILSPLRQMTDLELLFYCYCIKSNKYKYNYGRQANRTLKDLLVPDKMPIEIGLVGVNATNVPDSSCMGQPLFLEKCEFEPFKIKDIFEIKKGKRLTKEDFEVGDTPFVAAIDSNNGWRDFIGQLPIHDGNTISVNYNGSVAEAFYQPVPFWASDDVNVLYPKFEMNVFNALFIATIIEKERYRFNYGRKWHKDRMSESCISLPSLNGKPDFNFMENYTKSLPYSTSLEVDLMDIKPKSYKKAAKGLSDSELAEKYDTGKSVDFEDAIDKMSKSLSEFNSAKKKSNQTTR